MNIKELKIIKSIASVALIISALVTVTSMLLSLPDDEQKYAKQKIAIASIFSTENKTTNIVIMFFCMIASIGFILSNQNLYALFSVIILVLLNIQHFLLSYRIKKGYYANNVDEAFELIQFIVANSEKIDFSDGDGGMKRLLPEAEKKVDKVNASIDGVKI